MADAVNEKIVAQGDKIRDLKSKKADKAAVKAEVDVLLALKAEFKSLAGKDWKPAATAAATPSPGKKEQPQKCGIIGGGGALTDADKENLSSAAAADLDMRICNCGDRIRKLKSEKADVSEDVKTLLFLKGLYRQKAGQDWQPPEKRISDDNNKKKKKQEEGNAKPHEGEATG